MTKIWMLTAATLAAALFATAALAQSANPAQLGAYRDWSAFTVGTGDARICYALSQPRDAEPKNVRRDPIFFFVSNFPGRNVTGEPSVVPGYPYRDGSKVTVEIGSDKFEFFTKNDGTDGGAWMEDPADERRLIAAMKAGSSMIVKGTSSRGTLTTDQYSLLGLTAALESIDKACS